MSPNTTASTGARPGEEEVRRQPRPLVNILPAEQHVVFLQDRLDLFLRELLADRAAMLVEHHAARLVQHLPPALPRHVAQVGVFQVEGLQQLVESAELEKLATVEGATSAAAVEAGKEVVDCVVDAMAHAQAAVLPPALRQAGLFADFGRIGEEDLAGYREDFGIAEAFQQRRQEVRSHSHVAVQQHHDVVLRRAEAGIRSAAEAQVLRQREHGHIGKRRRAENRRCHRSTRCPPPGSRSPDCRPAPCGCWECISPAGPCPFQLGITTVAARLAVARPSARARAAAACFQQRSTTTSAKKLIAMRNGESSSSGSARMQAFQKSHVRARGPGLPCAPASPIARRAPN